MASLIASQRSDNLEWISTSLELLVAYLKGENMRGHFDINKLSEDFFCQILNRTYGLELENLNRKEKMNVKAIDLGDEKNKISYQVTSENTKGKIRDTITKFETDKKYETYTKLKFLILDRTKPSNIADLAKAGRYSFSPSEDTICVKDLLVYIEGTDSATIDGLYQYMKVQVPILDIMTEENVDQEIVDLIGELVNMASENESDAANLDFVEVDKKIVINFADEDDQNYIRAEYERCIERFGSIEEIVRLKGADAELILQSSMFDLYNKLKHKNDTNRDIFDKMISSIESSTKVGVGHAARRLAIKSLVMFHFDDCTIFEKTELEKSQTIFGSIGK